MIVAKIISLRMRMNEKQNMGRLYKLFRVQCADLLVLAEMEWRGMLYDTKAALAKADSLQEEVNNIVRAFKRLVNNDFCSISSDDHISAVLYGGVIKEPITIPIGHYKSGLKKGEIKYKNSKYEHVFPRLVSPLKDTETAANKAGKKDTYKVDEDTLKALKCKGDVKEIVRLVLEYRGLEKLRSTYLVGWARLIKNNCWDEDVIHGNLNQCVTISGRLSADKPNLQNSSKPVKKFLRSRYE